MRAKRVVTMLGALALTGCVPEWARNGEAPVVLLMTGMGAGLTWGSSLIEWTSQMEGKAAA